MKNGSIILPFFLLQRGVRSCLEVPKNPVHSRAVRTLHTRGFAKSTPVRRTDSMNDMSGHIKQVSAMVVHGKEYVIGISSCIHCVRIALKWEIFRRKGRRKSTTSSQRVKADRIILIICARCARAAIAGTPQQRATAGTTRSE